MIIEDWPRHDPQPMWIEGGYRKVVLVTGSRDWPYEEEKAIEEALDFLDPRVLIHGGARGADYIAHSWAKCKSGTEERFKISKEEWTEKGKMAGPERNQQMVERTMQWKKAGHRVLCLAFPLPESRGTIDCIERAVRAGIPVLRYE